MSSCGGKKKSSCEVQHGLESSGIRRRWSFRSRWKGVLVNSPVRMRESEYQSQTLGFDPGEDALDEGMATHSSILAWRIPMAGCSPWGRKESDLVEWLSSLSPRDSDGFWCTSVWIDHKYTCVPFILNPLLLPCCLPSPSRLSEQLWVPWVIYQTHTGHLFYIWQCICFNAIFSNHPTFFFSHWVQKSVLCVCVSFAALHIVLWVPSF